VAGSCEQANKTSKLHKMRGVSWQARDLLAFQEGLCSMQSVNTKLL